MRDRGRIEMVEDYLDRAGLSGERDEIMAKLTEMQYFESPSSIKSHSAYPGGNCDHCLNVTGKLLQITTRMDLKWENPRSPYIIGLFHDLCKCDAYEVESYDGKNVNYIKNKNMILGGHGDKSVMIAAQLLKLTEEEIMCIRYHMGAYETDKWKEYDLAIKKYPNVLWTHTADMLASKTMED